MTLRLGPTYHIRRRAAMSREKLARFAGVSMKTLERLERLDRHIRMVTIGDLVKVADALGCAPTHLVPGLKYSARDYRHREAPVRAAEREAGLSKSQVKQLLRERGELVEERPEGSEGEDPREKADDESR